MSGPVKVRKRPVVIEAYRYDGSNAVDVAHWSGGAAQVTLDGELVIHTLEGDHIASPGDYVLRGVEGEHYPVKPSIFEATYDPAEGCDLAERAETLVNDLRGILTEDPNPSFDGRSLYSWLTDEDPPKPGTK